MTLSADLPLLLPITALLPLTALLLVGQSNPYQSLVLRGILGAVAALIYALLGAADVALTEALVGTLLSTTLYAVALRSSMVLRLGYRNPQALPVDLRDRLCRWLEPACLRLELVALPSAAMPGASVSAAADLHGLLEWRADSTESLRVSLINAALRRRLAALPEAGDWRPLLLSEDLC